MLYPGYREAEQISGKCMAGDHFYIHLVTGKRAAMIKNVVTKTIPLSELLVFSNKIIKKPSCFQLEPPYNVTRLQKIFFISKFGFLCNFRRVYMNCTNAITFCMLSGVQKNFIWPTSNVARGDTLTLTSDNRNKRENEKEIFGHF